MRKNWSENCRYCWSTNQNMLFDDTTLYQSTPTSSTLPNCFSRRFICRGWDYKNCRWFGLFTKFTVPVWADTSFQEVCRWWAFAIIKQEAQKARGEWTKFGWHYSCVSLWNWALKKISKNAPYQVFRLVSSSLPPLPLALIAPPPPAPV
jgi:hypothetical protein